jgi:hypothetical protein
MDVPIPEVPSLADVRVVRHPESGRECLLAATEDGRTLAFAFEVESDTPGLSIVDPGLWLEAAASGSPEHSEARFTAVEEARADDWLQALVANPVAAEWLGRIKEAHPAEYHDWFAQEDYEEGGEGGGG